MNTRFFTNENQNTILEKFRAVFENNPQIAEFDALVGYFHAAGYFSLRPHLQNLSQIRVLVGINVDKITALSQIKGLYPPSPNSGKIQETYLEELRKEISESEYDLKNEQSILQFIEDIQTKKIVIKAHPSRNLHAKIYIFRPLDFNEHKGGEVITGSSNFTKAGLGADPQVSNYEFNVSLRDYEDIRFATAEFEKLWQESLDILPEAVVETKKKTYLRDDFTPFEIYIKLLIEYFGKEINFNPDSVSDIPKEFKRLNYQIDAVEQGRLLLKEHNGFFLSDVVGLGKTIVASLIARKYFFDNNYPEYRSHTLIVCPPAVKANWKETIGKFQIDNVKYITTGSLHKITDEKKYDLIIIDEAHKFRNHTPESYTHMQRICKAPCRDGNRKRVILVTATPLNNRPEDIRNQVFLFQDANDSTLDVNLARFFSEASKRYQSLIRETENQDSKRELESLYTEIRNRIIEPLTVRRTRTDLEKHDIYSDDLKKQGIKFPDVGQPQNLLYELNSELNDCYDQSFDRIQNRGGSGLKYARHQMIRYLKPQHRENYQSVELITEQLSGIVKSMLIKRLDSSFYAFYESLKRFTQSYVVLRQMIERDRIFIAKHSQIEKYILEEREDELIAKLESEQLTNPSARVFRRDDFEPIFFDLVEHDFQLLQEMTKQWGGIVTQQPDPKLQLLLNELRGRLLNSKDNPEQKLVVFSEAADTTDYLDKELKKENYRVLAITSSNREKEQDNIRQNFDANLSVEQQKSDYDIIITTETLAEGVNLHRANTIVNYDTPWNSIRLMQRIGRINRIGTRASAINIYNFFPTEKVESDISLRHRAQLKLQAFHTALGEDSQIYSTDEKVQTFGLFDESVTEDREVNERLNHLMDIRRFKEEDPDEFKRIKNLPLKIRNAVIDDSMKGSTLSFLSGKYNMFYKTDKNSDVVEIGFLEAASIFKSQISKDRVELLPESHYNQVREALAHFRNQVQEKVIQETQVPELNPQQRLAISYLKAFLKSDITGIEEKRLITEAINWIKLGRYQNLPRDIAKLQRSQKRKPLIIARQLDAAINIIEKHYPSVSSIEEQVVTTASEQNFMANLNPKIVISQSYVESGKGSTPTSTDTL